MFKIILVLSLLLNFALLAYVAHSKGLLFKKNNPNTKYPINYYIQKNAYDSLEVNVENIEFLGDSLTNYGQWSEFFNDRRIVNRGIVGDDTERLLNRINEVGTPKKLFIMAGINDLVQGKSVDEIVSNYNKLLSTVSRNSPNTKIYIESTLPINSDKYKQNYPSYKNVKNGDILILNNKIKSFASKYNGTFINLYSLFNKNGDMNPIYTVDGVHLTGEGYKIWANAIRNYIAQ